MWVRSESPNSHWIGLDLGLKFLTVEQPHLQSSWTCDKSPTWGCLGLAPMSGSKQWGIDILPIFLLTFGSSLQMCMASFASLVIWEGSLSIMLKLVMDGKGWWKSVQCLSMAEVVNLECSLTLSLRALDVSLTYRSYTHLLGIPSGRQHPSFGPWRSCLWDALAWIWGCSLPWNIPVWPCTWRSVCRTHSDLESRGLKCRIAS